MKYAEVIGGLQMEVDTLKQIIGQQNSCSRCFTAFKQLATQKNHPKQQLLINQNSAEAMLDISHEREVSQVFEERKTK